MNAEIMKDEWMLFETFKMSLYDETQSDEYKDEIGIKDELTALNCQRVKSSVIFIAAFNI